MKILICGPEESKWTEEQIPKAKEEIKTIFLHHACEGSLLKNRKGEITSLPTIIKVIENYDNLVLVSGHCPKGEERFYCVDCKKWIVLGAQEITPIQDTVKAHGEQGHRIVLVYDEGGVDTWAEIIATELGIKKEIYPAETFGWNDVSIDEYKWLIEQGIYEKTPEALERLKNPSPLKGYRSRNIDMAKACDVCYDIEPKGSCRHCGGQGYFVGIPASKFTCKFCKGTGIYSGGTFTMKEAEKLGKEVHQIIIE